MSPAVVGLEPTCCAIHVDDRATSPAVWANEVAPTPERYPMSNVNHLDLDTLHLDKGSHDSPEKGMCVMEAVALMAGETFTDAPSCASPVIRAFMVSWNDALPDDERQQLKRHIPALIGTAGTPEQETVRAWMATDWLVRVQAPAWLRLAGLTEQADILASMTEVTAATCPSILPALKAVRSDAAAAGAAAGAAARAAAGAAAWDAAWAAAWDAAWDAARAALNPTKVELQAEAHLLIERMIAVTA